MFNQRLYNYAIARLLLEQEKVLDVRISLGVVQVLQKQPTEFEEIHAWVHFDLFNDPITFINCLYAFKPVHLGYNSGTETWEVDFDEVVRGPSEHPSLPHAFAESLCEYYEIDCSEVETDARKFA